MWALTLQYLLESLPPTISDYRLLLSVQNNNDDRAAKLPPKAYILILHEISIK